MAKLEGVERENLSWKKEAKSGVESLYKERQEWEELYANKFKDIKKENDELKNKIKKLNKDLEAKNEEIFVFTEEMVSLAEELEESKKNDTNSVSYQRKFLENSIENSYLFAKTSINFMNFSNNLDQ